MSRILNEQLCISNTNPIRARHYDYRYFTYPWHFHSEYELMYVSQGRGECIIGDSMLSYGERTLILFGSELPHCMQNPPEYRIDEQLHVNGTIIQFEKDFMQYSFANYIQFTHIQKILTCANRGIVFDLTQHPEIQQMMNDFPSVKGLDQIILLLRLLQSLSEVSEQKFVASPNYNPTLAGIKDNKLQKVMVYLHRRYTSALTLQEVANFASMNPSAFCRYFKENVGKTLKEYIIEMRIGYACKLLTLGQLNISQISMECGFETISHFNRCFKKITGYTPSEFKAKF